MQQVNFETHPTYGRMIRLSRQIASDQNYNLDVVFSNAQGSICRIVSKGSYLVKYGRKMIARDSRIGYREYPFSFSYLWPNQVKTTGLKAAWALVIHEMAHTIQIENGKRKRGSQHNSYWAAMVQMLQKDYPFSEFAAEL